MEEDITGDATFPKQHGGFVLLCMNVGGDDRNSKETGLSMNGFVSKQLRTAASIRNSTVYSQLV